MDPSAHHHDHRPGDDDSQPATELFTEAFWDQRYGSKTTLWSGNPNLQLLEEASELPPGEALDAGCGEGADAIWLAERGWSVTAVDISTVALERGAAQARAFQSGAAGRIRWQQADLLSWEPPPKTFDLVSAQYIQLPAMQRAALFRRLAAGVAHGGTVLVVGHGITDLNNTTARPALPELFFTANEIAVCFDPSLWTIEISEARARGSHDHDGHAVTVHDEVFAARRK